MSEYYRDETHQFCDTELCMIIDTFTGRIERVFGGCEAVGRFDEALKWLSTKGCRQRNAIIKINCVGAFPLTNNLLTPSIVGTNITLLKDKDEL